LVLELADLSQQAQVGRQPQVDGLGRQEAPFYDLIGQTAFGGAVPAECALATRGMVRQILALLRSRIGIINFWQKPDEVSRLKGDLSDIFLMSDVEPIADGSERLVVEVANLARHRHELLMGDSD
jgi:type I restriction enzyme, R subunit